MRVAIPGHEEIKITSGQFFALAHHRHGRTNKEISAMMGGVVKADTIKKRLYRFRKANRHRPDRFPRRQSFGPSRAASQICAPGRDTPPLNLDSI